MKCASSEMMWALCSVALHLDDALFGGHLSRLPYELAHGYDARNAHAAHQHNKHAADVGQPQFVGS